MAVNSLTDVGYNTVAHIPHEIGLTIFRQAFNNIGNNEQYGNSIKHAVIFFHKHIIDCGLNKIGNSGRSPRKSQHT